MQLLPTHRDQGLSLNLYRVMKDEVKVAPQKVLIGKWRNHIWWVGDQNVFVVGSSTTCSMAPEEDRMF